jgi:hypothetical protein
LRVIFGMQYWLRRMPYGSYELFMQSPGLPSLLAHVLIDIGFYFVTSLKQTSATEVQADVDPRGLAILVITIDR